MTQILGHLASEPGLQLNCASRRNKSPATPVLEGAHTESARAHSHICLSKRDRNQNKAWALYKPPAPPA